MKACIVVICFQIVSLTYWFTALNNLINKKRWLWFAFRLYLWLIDSQLIVRKLAKALCCDLLSDCIFDLLIHSWLCLWSNHRRVVICFQIVSLTYWFTAFELLRKIPVSCDLLSDCIFDLLIHSSVSFCLMAKSVVICFQIVSLTYWFTAFR